MAEDTPSADTPPPSPPPPPTSSTEDTGRPTMEVVPLVILPPLAVATFLWWFIRRQQPKKITIDSFSSFSINDPANAPARTLAVLAVERVFCLQGVVQSVDLLASVAKTADSWETLKRSLLELLVYLKQISTREYADVGSSLMNAEREIRKRVDEILYLCRNSSHRTARVVQDIVSRCSLAQGLEGAEAREADLEALIPRQDFGMSDTSWVEERWMPRRKILLEAVVSLTTTLEDCLRKARPRPVRRADIISWKEMPPEGYAIIPIFYVTDRKPLKSKKFEWGMSIEGYNGKRNRASEPLDYGIAKVSIPENHHRGKVETPKQINESWNGHLHIMIRKLQRFPNKDLFIVELQKKVDSMIQNETKEGLVFIHGYNNTFEDAVRRAAQIKWDLEFEGPVIAYSWASAGHALNYDYYDARNVQATVPYLANFLQLLIAESHLQAVHVIAHSMGNRALVKALQLLHHRRQISTGTLATRMSIDVVQTSHTPALLKEVVFAAADVDQEEFLTEFGNIKTAIVSFKPIPRFTLYCSRRDAALGLSRLRHLNKLRAGDASVLLYAPGLDTIDATGTDIACDNHSYFAEAPRMLQDLKWLCKGVAPTHGYRALDAVGDMQITYRFRQT